MADAFIRTGQNAPEIVQQYAQGMIDQGNLTGARSALESIIARPDALETERAEALGLLGRIFKQLYVNANDPKSLRQRCNLRQAIDKYYGVYRISPPDYLWQGINTVALLHRARRDEVEVAGVPGADVLANEIAAILRTLPKLNHWDRATAIENCVALGWYKDANMHVLHYAEDPGVDAFEIGSLQRQLLEVWQLTQDREPGGTLLPVLESALLNAQAVAW